MSTTKTRPNGSEHAKENTGCANPDRPGRNNGRLLSGCPKSVRKQLPDGDFFEQTPEENAEDCALFQSKTYTKSVKASLLDWADKHTRNGAGKVLRYLIDCVGWYPSRPDYLRCLVRMDTIAENTGLSEKQVKRIVGTLQRRGLLLRRKRRIQLDDGTWRQRANSYTLLPGQVLIAKEPKNTHLRKNVPPVLRKNVPRIPKSENDQKTQLDCEPSSIEGAKSEKLKSWVEINKDTYKKQSPLRRRYINKAVREYLDRAHDSRHNARRINWDGRPGARNEGWVFTELLHDPELAYRRLQESMAKIPEDVRHERAPYRGVIINVFVELRAQREELDRTVERRYQPDPHDAVRGMNPDEIRAVIAGQLA